jgi:hypothetical protein
MTAVNPRAPLQIVVTSNKDEIDFDALCELSERAFKHNYAGKLRIVYDHDYYERLLAGSDWLGVFAFDENHRLVGCKFSLLRVLMWRCQLYPAAYSTNWAVDPAYRRTGVSLRIWQALSKELRERNCIGIGASHEGNSGTRSGVVFREPLGQRRVAIVVMSGVIWSRSLTGVTPINEWRSTVRMQRLCFVDGSYPYGDPDAPIDQSTFAQLLAESNALTFAPTHSFAQLYFNSELNRSGTLWLELGGDARCAVGYSMFTLALDDVEVGQIGRIQFILPFGCDDAQQAAALEAVCGFLQRAGCSSASLLDQRAITLATLKLCGFTPTSDQVTLSLGVQPSLATRFENMPWLALDFV